MYADVKLYSTFSCIFLLEAGLAFTPNHFFSVFHIHLSYLSHKYINIQQQHYVCLIYKM